MRLGFALVIALAQLACTAKLAKPSVSAPAATPIPLPDGAGGIGFDDLGFAPGLHRVLAPAGGTGNLDLVDPDTRAVTAIPGFSKSSGGAGHGNGTTSADEGGGFLFASDRDTRTVNVVDPVKRMIVASAPLAAGPDYVRFVAATHELWVTEPNAKQIEVFSLPPSGTPQPVSVATIGLDDGPESLVIDATRKRAYTHEWGSKSHAVDLLSHRVVATWENGCAGSRGIGLDEKKGFLFAGCDEGKAVVLDVDHDGRVLGSLNTGVNGVDIIAYNSSLGHLYLPGESSGTLAILAVSSSGALSPLAVARAGVGSHCAAADDRGNVWVCDPEHGQLLLYHDAFAASP
jgi:hypothetical protein